MDDTEERLSKYRRPNIWKMFRPVDVTLYDLIYEPYLGREPGQSVGLYKIGGWRKKEREKRNDDERPVVFI